MKDPKTFNEKIQWLKVYDPDPRKTRFADKYLVRDYVREKIGEQYLTDLLAVYDRAEEIDFASLPDAFVLKANHGSDMKQIVMDKNREDLKELRKKAAGWLGTNFAFTYGFELHYSSIPRKIIAEKLLENPDGGMTEFKIWCFSGKVRFLQMVRKERSGKFHAFFDTAWNRMPFSTWILPPLTENPPAPANLSEMIHLAEILSEGFSFVRVDVYLLDDGTIKFGEMTFTPASGAVKWNPSEADLTVGEMLRLPKNE